MINYYSNLAKELTKELKGLLKLDSKFTLMTKGHGFSYSIISQGVKECLVRIDSSQPTKEFAYPLFNKTDNKFYFLIYFRIRLTQDKKDKSKLKPQENLVSISIFKDLNLGLEIDLIELFRAEWDEYDDSKNYTHPQPHWHFTTNQTFLRSFELELKNFEDIEKTNHENEPLNILGNPHHISNNSNNISIYDFVKDEEEVKTDNKVLENHNFLKELYLLKKNDIEALAHLHFAMKADWDKNGNHIHSLYNIDELARWNS